MSKRTMTTMLCTIIISMTCAAFVPLVKHIKPSSQAGESSVSVAKQFPKERPVRRVCEWSGDEAKSDYHHAVPIDCNYRNGQY